MSLLSKALLIAAAIAISAAAFAADRPDSGSLLRESAPPPTLRPQEHAPKILPPLQQKEVAPAGLRVKVSGFTFTGNTVFSHEELTSLMSGYIGKELTLAELNAAAATITNAYRAKGYFLASANIPPQTIKSEAPIVIEIIEGVLEGVRLETKPAETRTPHSLLGLAGPGPEPAISLRRPCVPLYCRHGSALPFAAECGTRGLGA
jgi:hemolysin activation/secretion protein